MHKCAALIHSFIKGIRSPSCVPNTTVQVSKTPDHISGGPTCTWHIVLLVHCPDAWHLTVWIIIMTRWSLFYLFNPKSALLWWYIVNTHRLSCTFTLFFAHCSSWHFRHFLLEWFYTFQKYILHWGSLDHKCAFCFYPKASLFHILSWKVVLPVLCHSRMYRCFLSDRWRDDWFWLPLNLTERLLNFHSHLRLFLFFWLLFPCL